MGFSIKLNVQLLPDRKTAQIALGEAVALMPAPQLDAFIAALADIRANMQPEVPHRFPQGERVHRHQATRYAVGIDGESGLPTLALRTPNFGWLQFDFDRDGARAISALLLKNADDSERMSKPN